MTTVTAEAPPRPQDADAQHGPRPRTRRFTIATGIDELNELAGPGLTLDDALGLEIERWRRHAAWMREEGLDPATEDDRSVWEGGRLVAVLKPGPDGEPRVIRLEKDTRIVGTPGGPPPDSPIAREVELSLNLRDRYMEASKGRDLHEGEMERFQKDCRDFAEAVEQSQQRLAHLVIREAGGELPDDDRWYHDPRPIASLRVRNRLIVVTSRQDNDAPRTIGDLVVRSCVAVIDLD